MSTMKFCAQTRGNCSLAYDVGPAGRVGIVKDRDPVDAEKINGVLSFLAGKLSDEDLAQVEDMLDDAMDDAEEANPSQAAQDAKLSTGIRRTMRRAVRGVTMKRTKPVKGIAADAAGFAGRFPDASRIGAAPASAARPRTSMSAAQSADFAARYPDAARIKIG